MSTVSSVASTTPITTSTSSTTTPSNPSETLTQADFLQIMVAQFTQQDPLAGDDGSGGSSSGTSDYVDQLMSMTNLTTMQNMSSELTTQLAAALPGSTVELSVNGSPIDGVVQKTSVSNGDVYLTINGQQYDASNLVSIDQTAGQAAAAAAASAAAATTTPATTSTTGN